MRRLAAVLGAVVLGCGGRAISPGSGAPIGGVASAVDAALPAPSPPLIGADVKARLAELAHRAVGSQAPAPPDAGSGDEASAEIPAFGPCTRPTAGEQAALRTRITAWSTRPAPGMRAAGDLGPLAFGCMDHGAIIVDASRVVRGGLLGVWWVLRVTPGAITIVDRMEGDPPDQWGEWAAENTVRTLALVDLDGDGTLDPVRRRTRHEGGSVHADHELVIGDAPGTVVGGANSDLGLAADQPPPGEHTLLVYAARHPTSDPPPVPQLRCVTTAATWSRCPLADAGQRAADRAAAAELAINEPDVLLADPGLLDEQLAVLGVPAAERAPLLAYATPGTSAFATAIAKAIRTLNTARAARTNSEQAAVDDGARAALGGALRAALGEPACPAPTAAQATAARVAVARWIRGHERKADAIVVAPTCAAGGASSAIARWTRDTADGMGTLRAGLFHMKGAAVALTVDATGDDDGPGSEAQLAAKLSAVGPTLVALVETDKLIAVVDGVVTGTHARPADVSALTWTAGTADGTIAMTTDPLARTLDGDTATYWHATTAGVVAVATLARVPPSAPMSATDVLGALLERSERLAAAHDLLAGPPVGLPPPAERAELLAAAKLLGAPPALLDAAAAATN
ncbi:MAG: hypothetical protein K8W52_26095 [Deltaproteobacteria bacterium]|nr:hypothetical protein [Deltaproteobacteria bacterium]